MFGISTNIIIYGVLAIVGIVLLIVLFNKLGKSFQGDPRDIYLRQNKNIPINNNPNIIRPACG